MGNKDSDGKIIKVQSPLKLDPDQVNKIEKFMSKYLEEKKVTVENTVNPDIMGGIIVEFGSKILDLSIAGNIEKLGNEITGK